MNKKILQGITAALFFNILFVPHAFGQSLRCRAGLTSSEIESVKNSKFLLKQVNAETLEFTLNDIKKTSCPSIQVVMMDAMARTYDDLVREYDLVDLDARKRLYNKIQLNMAYFQFTAGRAMKDNSHLNRLIRKKIRGYLPAEVLDHPGFYFSLDE